MVKKINIRIMHTIFCVVNGVTNYNKIWTKKLICVSMQLSNTEWPIPVLTSYVTTLFHVPHRNANFQRSWRLPISPKNTSSDSKVHMFYYYLTLTWNISHTNYHLITNTVSCYYFVSLLPVHLQFSCCKLQGKIMLSFCFLVNSSWHGVK